jgi:molybdate transport system permease protein
VAVIASAVTFVSGTALAWFVMRLRHGKGLADGLLTLPLVLPPTVVGFFLLLLFGKNSIVGSFLVKLGASVVFTKTGAVVAATVVSFPLMYRTVRGALEQFDIHLLYAARTLGMREARILWRVVLPGVFPSLVAGLVLSFTRALGEFGATIMLAGNIPGRTQTMAVAIYTAMQSGNRALAFRWAGLICLISLGTVVLMNLWNARQNRYRANGGWIAESKT